MTNVTAPKKRTKWLLLAIGWLFMALALVGLFLPVLQGVLFLLIGLIILSSEYVWAHRLLFGLKQRFPHVAGRGHESALRAMAWFHSDRPDSMTPRELRDSRE